MSAFFGSDWFVIFCAFMALNIILYLAIGSYKNRHGG